MSTDRNEQIKLYVGLNRGQVRVSDPEILKAQKVAKNKSALAVCAVFDEHGFNLGSSTSATGVSSHAQVQSFTGYSYEKGGEPSPESLEALGKALDTIRKMWPNVGDSTSAKQRTNSAVLFGLARVFRDATNARDGSQPDVESVVETLKRYKGDSTITPGIIITLASEARVSRGNTIGGGDHLTLPAARAILKLINGKRQAQNKLTAPWLNEQQ